MLEIPVPIGSLKSSNIEPGYYLDGRPEGEYTGAVIECGLTLLG